MLIRSSISQFVNRVRRSKGGLWIPSVDLFMPWQNNICIVRERAGRKWLFGGFNIVTNNGDTYYAQRGAAETPTNDFNDLFLSTVAFSPAPSKSTDAGDLASTISGGEKAVDATYPRTNDPDADNTGSGVDVVTHRFSYSAADFNDPSIEGLTIAVSGTTFGSGTDPLLNAANLTAFDKQATDTLKVFVNHTMNGV